MDNITLAVFFVSFVTGLAYVLGVGVITLIDLFRYREDLKSAAGQFGLALAAMAFTCGPHHLIVAYHIVAEGARGGMLELITVGVGAPFACVWLWLRLEAFFGGRGDRIVNGGSTPGTRWVAFVAQMWPAYLVGLGMYWARVWTHGGVWHPMVAANIVIAALYVWIGNLLATRQRARFLLIHTRSLSGLTLAWIFYTCALMHLALGYYVWQGSAYTDWHLHLIDYLSIPFALWFLAAVYRLYKTGQTVTGA